MENQNFEIKEHIAVLSENPKSHWTKEINLVSWYGREPKYDIRDWAPNREKYGKGVTLTATEWDAIVELAQKEMHLEGLNLEV